MASPRKPSGELAQERRTYLSEVHRRAGARFVEWEGRLWVDHFGDPEREHHAVRRDVGVWDLSPLRKWELRGRRAAEAAEEIFTHDIRALEPGQIRYSPFCDRQGMMIGDATVFKVREDRLWLFTARDSDGEHVSEVARGFDVATRPITDELGCLQVQGPGARDLLSAFVPDIADLAYFRFSPEPVGLANVSCWVARIGYSGEVGYELFCASGEAEALWNALLASGASPYGLAAAETLRIEAGLIRLGREYVPHRSSPYDLSLDELVCLEKDRFIGKEALQGIATRPPRRLVTTVVEDHVAVPPPGAPISIGGRRIGTVTSSCRSPTFNTVIALGIVDRASAEEGPGVEILPGSEELIGTIRPGPMLDWKARRIRFSDAGAD